VLLPILLTGVSIWDDSSLNAFGNGVNGGIGALGNGGIGGNEEFSSVK